MLLNQKGNYGMENSLILVALNDEQIEKAKAINGQSKRITHALLCGSYGQIFGTEKHCLKYYMPWKDIFRNLFKESKSVQTYEISQYESTFDLVNILIAASDQHKVISENSGQGKVKIQKVEKKGFWARIFG